MRTGINSYDYYFVTPFRKTISMDIRYLVGKKDFLLDVSVGMKT